jgi:phosphoglycolate phosphatase
VAAEGLDPAGYRELDLLAIAGEAARHLVKPREFLAQAEAALVELELEACERAEPAEGARETLDWLRAHGIRIGIVTRNCRTAVERLLSEIPLPHDVLITRGDTERVKPDPLHLLQALRRLEVPPSRAVMVGDHVMDIRSGQAAGARTLGILLPDRPPDYFAAVQPDGILYSLRDLRAWISPSSS